MLKESMQEQNGNFSSTRLIMYATAATVLGTYLAHNIVSMVKGGGMVDFAVNSAVMMGIVVTGKVTQKFAEKKKATA